MHSTKLTEDKKIIDLQAMKIAKLEAQLAELHNQNEALKRMAFVDSLTGCYNRRAFDDALKLEISNGHRNNDSFTIILIDIDHFKKYNDAKGHQAGDELLSGLGSIWKATIERTCDRCFRYGGEEFVVILPNTTKDQVSRVVSLIKKGAAMLGVTVSMGIADNTESWTGSELVALADERLYQAKQNGRNQACSESKMAIAS